MRASKFYDWRERYGRVNEHNGWVPRDFWLQPWEKQAIIGFHREHPLEGYRRLTFMMLDADVVAVSPSSVWRVLQQAGLLSRWKGKPSRKGSGFEIRVENTTPVLGWLEDSVIRSDSPDFGVAESFSTCADIWIVW